jgi:hypothetical protein
MGDRECEGHDVQRAYFSDLSSLGNAHCTIRQSRLPVRGARFPWYMGSEQEAFQLSAIFVPALPMRTRAREGVKAAKPGEAWRLTRI